MERSPIETLIGLTKPARAAVRAALVRLGRVLAPIVVARARRPKPARDTHLAPCAALGQELGKSVFLPFIASSILPASVGKFSFTTTARWIPPSRPNSRRVCRALTGSAAPLPMFGWRSCWLPSPACQRRRVQNNYTLKFFDSLAFAPGSHYVVLDGDVLFFAPPPEIIAWADTLASECWFNWEEKEAYGAPRAQWKRLSVFLSGAISTAASAWCSSKPSLLNSANGSSPFAKPVVGNQHVVEQALFAVSASAFNRGGSLPPKYEISKRILPSSGGGLPPLCGPLQRRPALCGGTCQFALPHDSFSAMTKRTDPSPLRRLVITALKRIRPYDIARELYEGSHFGNRKSRRLSPASSRITSGAGTNQFLGPAPDAASALWLWPTRGVIDPSA